MKGKDVNDLDPAPAVHAVGTEILDANTGEGEGVNNHADLQQDEEERKITQTDHLNKKLLSSFLERLNQDPSIVPSECSNNATTSEADEFEDTGDDQSG